MFHKLLIRIFDFTFSVIGFICLLPVFFVVMIFCYFDSGQPFFVQERVGKNKKPFYLIKFRTMRLGTASVATHLADIQAVTKLGAFLRRVKLDELPQLLNVIKGDMSLVGPRPCLFNQTELISTRSRLNVYSAKPGITGIAQINGIDMSTPERLAKVDAKLLDNLTLVTYFRLIFLTLTGRGKGDAICSQ